MEGANVTTFFLFLLFLGLGRVQSTQITMSFINHPSPTGIPPFYPAQPVKEVAQDVFSANYYVGHGQQIYSEGFALCQAYVIHGKVSGVPRVYLYHLANPDEGPEAEPPEDGHLSIVREIMKSPALAWDEPPQLVVVNPVALYEHDREIPMDDVVLYPGELDAALGLDGDGFEAAAEPVFNHVCNAQGVLNGGNTNGDYTYVWLTPRINGYYKGEASACETQTFKDKKNLWVTYDFYPDGMNNNVNKIVAMQIMVAIQDTGDLNIRVSWGQDNGESDDEDESKSDADGHSCTEHKDDRAKRRRVEHLGPAEACSFMPASGLPPHSTMHQRSTQLGDSLAYVVNSMLRGAPHDAN